MCINRKSIRDLWNTFVLPKATLWGVPFTPKPSLSKRHPKPHIARFGHPGFFSAITDRLTDELIDELKANISGFVFIYSYCRKRWHTLYVLSYQFVNSIVKHLVVLFWQVHICSINDQRQRHRIFINWTGNSFTQKILK